MVFIRMKRNAEDAEKEEEDAEGLLREIDDVTLDAVAEEEDIEVDQEAEIFLREAHVGMELSFVDWNNCRNRFDFNDDAFVNEKIDSVGVLVQSFTFIENLCLNLSA